MVRHLIVCCDGTWNDPGDKDKGVVAPTNVFRLFNSINVTATEPRQLAHYQPGVGTGGLVDAALGGVVGYGLGEDIRDCYYWLAAKYEPGDKLFLFGFSRGAFTARSLAGMICQFGIVDRRRTTDLDSAIKCVYRQGYRDKQLLPDIKFTDNSDNVHFIGVWDTVGALGIPDDKALLDLFDDPSRYQFHDTSLSVNVSYARHAVAIDEKRGSFSPTLWTEEHSTDHDRLRQIWFPGVHCDVGGGYRERGLSDGALKWMIDESLSKGLKCLDKGTQISPDPSDVLHDSHVGLMKLLVTVPRAIPPVASQYKARLHSSIFDRRDNPPIEQARYLPLQEEFPTIPTEFDVHANQPWNWTGVYLSNDHTYRFTATGQWLDRDIACGPAGMTDGKFNIGELIYAAGDLLGAAEKVYRRMSGREAADFMGSKRCEHADWFELVGAIADGGNPGLDGTHDRITMFGIGERRDYRPMRSGYLYCFANDGWGLYGNTSVPQSQAQASASCGRARSGGEWVVKRSSRGRRSKTLS